MTIVELESLLALAEVRRKAASDAMLLLPPGKVDMSEYRAACELERKLRGEIAAAKGEEHAVSMKFPVKWDIDAPVPQLLRNEDRTLLLFRVDEVEPGWESAIQTIESNGDFLELLALIEFFECVAASLGPPDNLTCVSHPLYYRGFQEHTAQKVVNSRWWGDLVNLDSVQESHDFATWQTKNHYIFWFQESTLECIARSFKVNLYRARLPAVMAAGCKRLLEP